MSTNILKIPERKALLALTALLSGRAMTLAYIARAGGEAPGDPPLPWLMPLLGDAVVGVSALLVGYVLLTRRGLAAWSWVVVWNAVALWDALSAFVVHTTTPWPEFFMVRTFGASMFFMAAAMHAACLVLCFRPRTRRSFGLEP